MTFLKCIFVIIHLLIYLLPSSIALDVSKPKDGLRLRETPVDKEVENIHIFLQTVGHIT